MTHPHLASTLAQVSSEHGEHGAAFAATHVAPSSATHGTAARDDATMLAPSVGPGSAFAPPTSAARTTVLPHVDGDGTAVQLSLESRSRYEPTKLLGAGGMGEVVLVRDHDIERKVALKRLLPEMTDPAVLARFVDEIRTVGRLEHPNIVPIHDVGVDELGRYFFVMKYVEGETLEPIIEKLAAGRPGLPGEVLHRGAHRDLPRRCSTPSSTPTRRAWCTATSSPPTSWWAASARWC